MELATAEMTILATVGKYRVFFFTGPVIKVLSMELVPPNKEIYWFRHKSSISMELVPPKNRK